MPWPNRRTLRCQNCATGHMFRRPAGKRPHKSPVFDGRAPPKVSELIIALVPGGPSEKLSWLREHVAAGKLDGDDPEEVAQAEALLAMLVRLADSKGGKERRHIDELLDEGLRGDVPGERSGLRRTLHRDGAAGSANRQRSD